MDSIAQDIYSIKQTPSCTILAATLFWNSAGHLLQEKNPYLSYFELSYVFWEHNDSVGRGTTVTLTITIKCPRKFTPQKSVHEMSPKVSTRSHPFCLWEVTYHLHEMSATLPSSLITDYLLWHTQNLKIKQEFGSNVRLTDYQNDK